MTLSERAGRLLTAWRGKVTPAGWILFSSLCFTALVGLDTESSIAFQAFAILAAIGLVAFLGSLFFRGRFTVSRMLPRFGTQGQVLRYRVRVANDGDRIQSGLTLHEVLTGSSLDEERRRKRRAFRSLRGSFRLTRSKPKSALLAWVKPLALPEIPAQGVMESDACLLPGRRGLLELPSVRISRTDPFGMLRAFRTVLCPQSVLILPKRYRVPDLQLPGREQYQLGGVTQASGVGRSEEFVSLREYRRGDPLRHIHWRSWAKRGEPIVKEFEDEFFVRHGLVLDTFADDSVTSEIFEEAVSVAASFACTLRNQESLLDLMFVGTKAFLFTAGRGVGHTDQLLEILAGAQPVEEGDFEALTSVVIQHSATLTACVLVLIRWDASRQTLVERLLQLGVPVHVFLIRDAASRPEVDPGPLRSAPHLLRVLRAGHIEQDIRKG